MSAEPVGPIGPGDLIQFIGPRLYNDPEIGSVWKCLGAEETDDECENCRQATRALWIENLEGPQGYPWCANHWAPVSRRSDFERFLTEVTAPRDDVGESADPTIPAKEPHHAVR